MGWETGREVKPCGVTRGAERPPSWASLVTDLFSMVTATYSTRGFAGEELQLSHNFLSGTVTVSDVNEMNRRTAARPSSGVFMKILLHAVTDALC